MYIYIYIYVHIYIYICIHTHICACMFMATISIRIIIYIIDNQLFTYMCIYTCIMSDRLGAAVEEACDRLYIQTYRTDF